MSYVIPNLATFTARFANRAIGTGQCVALVEAAIPGMPRTPGWKEGRKVQGDLTVPCGAAIACFDPDGTFGNHTDGRSHAAIYLGQTKEGLVVWDQWLGQPAGTRLIRFRPPGEGLAVNNGSTFSVIEPF